MWRKQVDVRPSSPAEAPAPWSPMPVADPAPAARHASRVEEASAGSRAESRIVAGLRIRGEVSGDSSLHFEGAIEGAIQLRDADLTIGPAASVRGHVHAREVRIEGRVEGDVRAAARILLRASSHVEGDLVSPRIAIEDGAHFSGRVEMARPGSKDASVKQQHSPEAQAATASPAGVSTEPEPEQLSTGLFDTAKYAGGGS
jgi:cytoskeletal protein CcmA (bactofilin family)